MSERDIIDSTLVYYAKDCGLIPKLIEKFVYMLVLLFDGMANYPEYSLFRKNILYISRSENRH